ncbi:hypothetical protein [Mycolicibacter algericus]|uniref:Terminase small subunit n=2 Tax=Mycolicibacter algericus TaxID=1288388 RepID=A0A7I9YHA7_MYCAL|nr:hypothetical protein [Mycolicibacter algericus]OQZ97057.1 hypothetical protein BST10_10135 [Mycolicibacter algericus DSM 45454]GFG83378.1 hypothetical protein MALGJ_00540 [Mycolicibacter algericus]GFG87912.1 hypothetical protein MALGJ_45880 [Mycolicibacter algericus]
MAAPAKRTLRSVKPDEKPVRKRALNVAQAAKTGDQLALLIALRDRIAREIAALDCPPRDLASLSRKLIEIGKEIEAIKLRKKQLDDETNDDIDDSWDEEAL